MCVIVHKPIGSEFPLNEFNQCWARNSHGLGYIVISNDGQDLLTDKGLMLKDKALEAVKPYFGTEYDLIMHFRIQSRGGVSEGLTHPFNCSYDNHDRWIFHNGTVKCIHNPKGSDTEFLGRMIEVLPSDNDVVNLLQYFSDQKFGRFVLVDKQGDIFRVRRFDEASGESVIDTDGIWYSNLKHRQFTGKTGSIMVGDGGYDEEEYYSSRYSNYSNCAGKSHVPPVPPQTVAPKSYINPQPRTDIPTSTLDTIKRLMALGLLPLDLDQAKDIFYEYELHLARPEFLTTIHSLSAAKTLFCGHV